MVNEFVKNAFEATEEIVEMVVLGPNVNNEHFRRPPSRFTTAFDESRVMDVDML